MANKQTNDTYYDTSIALLEQSIGHINETLIRFEKRFDRLDERMDSMENKLEAAINKLDSRTDSNFKWLLGMIVAGLGSVLGIMAHGFHWL